MVSKQIIEAREAVKNSIKELAVKAETENRELNTDEQESWKKLNEEYEGLKAELSKATVKERAEDLEKESKQVVNRTIVPDFKSEKRDANLGNYALQAWLRTQAGKKLETRHYEAANHFNLNLNHGEIELSMPIRNGKAPLTEEGLEKRYMATLTGAAGGFLIPEGLMQGLEKALLQFGNVRALADVIRTSDGRDMPFPTVNDTSNEGHLIAESTAAIETDPVFAQKVLHAYKLSSDMVRIPTELLEDSMFPVESLVGDLLNERIARGVNRYLTTGTGVGQPQGAVTGATLGKTFASGTAITADELKDLVASQDPAYRPGSVFMMADATANLLFKLKDSANRYLWDNNSQQYGSLVNGMVSTIIGYPVVINNQMPAPTTGNKAILFGDFKSLKVREVGSVRLVKLSERYAEFDQICILAWFRFDSQVINAGVSKLVYGIMA